MDRFATTPKTKSKITARADRINMTLFVLVILLAVVITVVVIRDINQKAATDTYYSLPDLINLLPVVIVMLSTLLVYVIIRDVLMKRLIFTPLNQLTQSVMKGMLNDIDVFSGNRDDEIGDLARAIQFNSYARQQQEQLLHAVNNAAVMLLALMDEADFEASLTKGMEIIGRCVDVDRIHIWRNDTSDGILCYVNQARWLSDIGKQCEAAPIKRPYSDNPGWEEKFLKNEYINGPVASRTQDEVDVMSPQGVKSILAIPLYIRGEFYGFFSFDDCRRERVFTDDEVAILRVAGLMMVNAVQRNQQGLRLHKEQEHTQVLLDAVPLAIHLWSRKGELFGCNDEAAVLFGTKDKQDFLDKFFQLSPEYQPDGQLSSEKAINQVMKAFDEGRNVFEWMHTCLDGSPLPAELTLVRIELGDEDFVAGYMRDLRRDKQMVEEITRRDHLLSTVNNAAAVLFQSGIDEFENELPRCLGMMGKAVNVDRVCIWKNYVSDNQLHCTQVYEWLDGAPRQMGTKSGIGLLYDASLPSWPGILSQGKCINSLISTMPPVERADLGARGILSIFVVPVFVNDYFWGFVGFDDFKHERLFTENEELILRSGSIMIANALLRNDMAQNIRDGAVKLEAVISNYPGIIWSVDTNNILTLFNGRYLGKVGIEGKSLEGKNIDDAMQNNWFDTIRESTRKTFAEGPQDMNFEVDGRVYRIRTTLIYDGQGRVINAMGNLDDITERTQLQKDLKAALEEAQAANEAKSNFLANMSHEMRTPLNAVIGLSELSLGTSGLNEETSVNLEKIYNAGSTLLSTVNDILDISKIEAGKLELVMIEYDIPSLVNDAVTQSIMRIGEKPIRFSLDIMADTPLRLCGDDLRLKQILNNLLSNAFKYTKEGTVELGIRCEREPSSDSVWMNIRVSDTGNGIRKEDMKNLFSDYTQVDLRSNRKIEGTGLGLSITKRIAEMMDGSVSVESEYGKGSTFTVRIRQKFVNDTVIGEEVAKSLKELRYSESKRSKNSQLNRIRLPYARVMVVDDVETNLDVARGMMKPYGMQIDCINNGQAAVDAVRAGEVRYNAIFMDHMMPEMDGIEAVRIIREEIGTEYAKTVPIIALTANAIVGNERMFLSKGFHAFLTKPIEIANLDSVIRKWVRDKEKEQELADKLIEVGGEQVLDIRSGKDRRQPFGNRRGGPGLPVFHKKINGVDIDKGMQRFGKDWKIFMKILHSFAGSTPSLLEKIKKENKDNLPNYAITVHGIKGSSRSICAESIGDKAEALEKAAKAGDVDFVIANNADFINAVENLIIDLKDALDNVTIPKPKKDKPDRVALDKLVAACDANDIDKVDTIMEEIDYYEYESDDGLALWLRENVDEANFTQIKEKLATI